MALKKTTVMVEEEYLETIKQAAARDGRPESEYFREAFKIAALRAQRWPDGWDIPELAFGHRIEEHDVQEAVEEAAGRERHSGGTA